jgi:hypothetical protein
MKFEFVSVRALAQNHDDGFDTTASQIIDAGFNKGFWAEGKQRFECAHTSGTSRGKDYGCNRIGLRS